VIEVASELLAALIMRLRHGVMKKAGESVIGAREGEGLGECDRGQGGRGPGRV
jgi:hypothetical protein